MDQIENGWIVSAKAAEVPQRTFYRKELDQAIAILKVLPRILKRRSKK